MSRMSVAPSQRNLSLTEELEKLEQSITLTLQEIDHNFSRAHRIVTSSILPVVEQYAEHSKNVWEGSKFWKQFFEASANVSLNGYEETATEDDDGTIQTEDTGEQPSSSYASPPPGQTDFATPASTRYTDHTTSSTSDFPSPDFSTPKAQTKYNEDYSIASHASPYEKLRREVQGVNTNEDDTPSNVPSTPRGQTTGDSTFNSSPFEPPSTTRSKTPAKAKDVLMHRVLDKNYRIQATPHAEPLLPKPGTVTRHGKTPAKTPATARKGYTRTLDLDSSPMEEAPELHLDFTTPGKNKRVPGVSVLTPGKPSPRKISKGEDVTKAASSAALAWDSDSDDDALPPGMSPPKTMQFHIPQSKLLRTPAQEASRMIVEDLLTTAGGNTTDEIDFDHDPDSPSVIKKANMEDDTF